MGFFSFKTADTKRSIFNSFTGKCKTVYLLQPNGEPPIKEDAYEGYGVFGGVDCYEWLAKANFSKEELADMKARGISIRSRAIDRLATFAEIYFWVEKKEYLYRDELIDLDAGVNYSTPQDRFGGLSVNDMMEQKRITRAPAPEPKFPLKFSFNPKAVYEALPASEDCPNQGYF